MKTTIAQFIPITLIVWSLAYGKRFVQFSYTILGKIMAIALILFYTYLDKYLGLVICLIAIIYYQSDFVENMLNTDEIVDKMVEKLDMLKSNKNVKETQDKVENMHHGAPKYGLLSESMSNIDDVYNAPEESNNKEGLTTVQQFRHDNCKDNVLMYKNMKVNNDMISHVFPNVEFKKGQCNVCDSTCDFSIIENRLKTEKELFYSDNENTKKSEQSTCESCKK